MISYKKLARQILEGQTLSDKLISLDELQFDDWSSYTLPEMPARMDRIAFTEERIKFPKPPRIFGNEGKAIALHSFANHELLAIEMMAGAILVYPHKTEEEIRFKKGILKALEDEQKHFSLYVQRINELGYEFGDFPVNDFFWKQMPKMNSAESFAAVMSLTFEAANLDFAQYYRDLFKSDGDLATAEILNIVLEDEISHVAFGSHWMKRWRGNKTLWDYYLSVLPHPLTPARGKGLFFDPAVHKRAMGDDEFVDQLTNYDDPFRVTRRRL